MSNSLTYCYLPDEIRKWPGLPLSLSGEEVMPLDYRAGDSGWLLYGRELDKKRISEFQHKLGVAIVVVSSWRIDDYQVVRIAGSLTRRIRRLSDECGLDVVPFGQIPRLRSPGLLVMDMDSTAIQIECIDEIAKLAGVGDKVAEITEQAMQGEMDFSESLKLRVAQLAGADANILQKVMDNLPLMPGLTSLVRKLQAMDWQIAIASGGFTYFADNLKQRLRLVAAVANQLEIKDGKLTGKVKGPIVDAKYKAQVLTRLAKDLDIPLEQTIAIGDGANDLKMLRKAGLGIAYHAKPKVYAQAKVAIRHADLMGVMCILSVGLKHEER